MHDLVILIPAYNEIKNLSKILKSSYNYFIIDDCSNDGTEEFLKKKKINYIRNLKNIGYEESLIIGLNYLKNKNFKYVCTVDGDGEHPINKIKKIYLFAKNHKADLVICNRKYKNRFLEYLLSVAFQIRFGLKDPMSGMKIYYMPKLNKIINIISNKNYLVDIITIFIKKKYKILNFEIVTKKKIGTSKIGYGFSIQLKMIKIFKYII
jgi:hypothetical protein